MSGLFEGVPFGPGYSAEPEPVPVSAVPVSIPDASGHGRSYARSVIPSEDREKDDFYPTPAPATRALLAKENFGPKIWEPACGDGAISRVLTDAGHEVVSTDLMDRGFGTPRVDFLNERKLLAPEIVTNPPFKMAEEFVRHALDLGASKVAMMLRLAWLEGSQRKKLFESTPLARVLVASRRLSMARGGTNGGNGGGSMIAFAWFVWDCTHRGSPELAWFDWKDAKGIEAGTAVTAQAAQPEGQEPGAAGIRPDSSSDLFIEGRTA
jgi:hypothetical protein